MTPASREHLTDWLALTLAPGLGPRRIGQLVERFGSAAGVRAAGRGALAEAGVSNAAIAALDSPDQSRMHDALAWAEHAGADLLTPELDAYPPRLRELPAAPPLLFVRGDKALLSEPQIAVVGSRNPTAGGAETARDFAGYLAGLGLVITSGLALGVDAAAHRGALDTGRTVAVLGTRMPAIFRSATASSPGSASAPWWSRPQSAQAR